jgi:hypothetical protein
VTVQIINVSEFDLYWNWLANLLLATYSECLARPAVSQARDLQFSSNFTDLPLIYEDSFGVDTTSVA